MNRQSSIFITWFWRALSSHGFAIAVIFTGCGGPPSGTVTGNVTYKGEPVFLGTIAFHGEDGRTVSAAISAGRYFADKVPLGLAKLTVQAHPPTPQMTPPPFGGVTPSTGEAPPPPAAVPKFIPLPTRYADKVNSALSYEVKVGEQTHDLALAP